jgi:dTDP-4-dehydrorhamnose reductase
MKKKILVTGALGQLGQAVLEEFHNHYHVIGVDLHDNSPNYPIKYIPLDITDNKRVKQVIEKEQPDTILHLAAMTNVDGCETNPELAFKINVSAVETLCTLTENRHFIHISSDYVFDGNKGPYSETDKVNPINVYGQNKLDSENIVKKYKGTWTIVRTNVVFDYTKDSDASFVKWVVDSLKDGKPIRVVDDQWNNPTWTVSMARTLRLIVDREAGGLFNYSGRDWLHRLDFTLLIADIFELNKDLISPISTADLKQAAKRPLKSGLITSLIEEKLGATCDPLDDCLKEIKHRIESN